MFEWFKQSKIKVKSAETLLLQEHEAILTENTPLDDQFKLMTIRGIMIGYSDGSYSDRMYLPEGVHFDIRRKLSNVGLLVEGLWYESRWTFDCTVDIINPQWEEMEELHIPDIVAAFKRAVDKARINGHMEVVVYGSPRLLNVLLPFLDILEMYVNKLTPLSDALPGAFSNLMITNANHLDSFQMGNTKIAVTKGFELNSYKYYHLVNLNPLEIKSGL